MQTILPSFTKAHNITDMMEAGLLIENWSWVDQRLQELYYAYALNDINSEDYMAAGLLPMDVDEEQDTNLLRRKHLRSLASAVQMDIQLTTRVGMKRARDEQEDQVDGSFRKIRKIDNPGKTIIIPNYNKFIYVNVVSDDESEGESENDNESDIDISDDDNNLAEALENSTIHSDFDGLFPMSIDGDEENDLDLMSIDSNN